MAEPEGADQTSRRNVLRGAVVAGVTVPFLAACAKSSPDSTATSSTTSDVPVGGGLILGDPQVVITQPTAGAFKGFSSICTHQGCPVDNVTDGTINCICHGSMFSIEDGSVVGGPAPSPLPAEKLTITGKNISLA
ncbi:MAG: Rieske (2Fe-2S) protein [Nocardioidaceae bacterium]|nr:Rieske (2Fe-2S) protein [Nocardioidaceae bacterium]